MKGKAQFEELWEQRPQREQTIEDEFLSLHAMPPCLVEDIHVLFKESLTDSISRLLGESGARALVRLMDVEPYDDPPSIVAKLDYIFREGSEPVKKAVAEEFRLNVSELLRKTGKRLDHASKI